MELGLNFAIPNRKHEDLIIQIGINVEERLGRLELPETDKDIIRGGVSRILKSEVNKPDNSTNKYTWLKEPLKHLRNDNSITICPADKGNTTVILNRED